jgi:hypothetical protein
MLKFSDSNGAFLNNNKFDYNFILLNSKNNRQIIVGLQNIFFDLAMGLQLTPKSRERLENTLKEIILENADEEARRYAYTVGTFFLSKGLSEICMQKICNELDIENRSWAFALLSKNIIDPYEFDKIKKLEHGLSEDVIKLISYVFRDTDLERGTILRIISKNESLSLYWLGWIEICDGFIKRYNKKRIYLDKGIITDLSLHDDQKVGKRIMASLWMRHDLLIEKEQITRLKAKYLSHDDGLKKWFFTAIWKNTNIITSHNHEYVKEILSLRHLFGPHCSPKTREGIARGLSGYKYDKNIISNIIEWITNEDNPTTKDFLLQYISKYHNSNKNFKYVLNEILSSDHRDKKLVCSILTETQISTIIGEKNMKNIRINKNYGQINIAESQAKVYAIQHNASESKKQIDEIYFLINSLKEHNLSSETDSKNLESAKRELEKNQTGKAICFLKKIGKETWDIAKGLGLHILSELITRRIDNP